MKNKDLISEDFREGFFALVSEKKIPISIAMRILKLKRVLEQHGQDSESLRQVIIEKHSLKDNEGNPLYSDGGYKINNTPEFRKEWEEYLNLEWEIPVDLLMKESEFSQLNIEVTVNQLQALIENLIITDQ